MALKKEAVIFYVVSFVLFVIGIFFDKKISEVVSYFQVEWLTEFMKWVSYIGTWFIVLVFMAFLFLWTEKKRKWIIPLLASFFISLAITYFLKGIISRPRPLNIIVAETNSSFPSGHATAVFSTLAVLDREFPRLRWFWLAFSILVVASRVYLNAHYLTDVIIGSVIGYSIGLLVVYITGKIKR